MLKYLQSCLEFQKYLGIDTSFDFATGNDYFKKKETLPNAKIKSTADSEQEIITMAKEQNNNITTINRADINTDLHFQTEKLLEIKQKLRSLKTFDELEEMIKTSDICELKRHATNDVIYDGNKNAKIMLIGEAPGENEDLEGKPFCGQSGQLLRKALQHINLNTENLLITNTIYWRPPLNRKPTEDEIQKCYPFLLKMIEIVQPKILILCGATAIETLTKEKKKMSEVAGKQRIIQLKTIDDGSFQDFPVFSIYHPSFLLRQPNMKKTFWLHLLNLEKELKNLKLI